MREAEFKAWLEARGYDTGTVSAQLARVTRLERAYGDLDELYLGGGLDRLQRELVYSKDDERAGKPNPAAFAIEGNLYNGLASVRKTIDYYRQFIEAESGGVNRTAHAALIARLAVADIEATMADCDAVGIDRFLREHGYVRPSNWVVRPSNGQRYPAKAIVGIAAGKLPGERPLRANEYFGGFGETQSYARLKELGYTIVGREASELADPELGRQAVEAAMNEYDHLGQAAFLAKYERGLQGTRYWVRRATMLYPSKAIANAAFEIQHGERGTYGGTEARRQLVRLGFTITDREGRSLGAVADADTEPGLPPSQPTNLILYGPPGTGKTYVTAMEAVRLCGEAVPDDREALMTLYRLLHQKGRIAFVTFHQNFSYEDFVEGLRPVTGTLEEGIGAGAGFSLQPQDGIFKLIADLAASNRGKAVIGGAPVVDRSRKIFKMSLGRSWASEDDAIYQDAIRGGYVVLGWGGEVDWSDPRFDTWEAIKERWRQDHPDATGNDPNMSQMYTFRISMQIGSLVVISDGNRKFRAVGEIVGPYQFVPGPSGEYNHRRAVRWLWHSDESLPRELIYDKELSQVSAYQMNSRHVNWEGLEQIVAGGAVTTTNGAPESFVLIIDEINRANISKVFGELITLLEPDKRLGMPNALTVRLPYSKQEFGVPANLHIVGTMNTADRSIALLDTALRRRFTFREVAPDPSLLPENLDDVPLRRVLETINDRVEYLVDREHRIGHAFFLSCRSRANIDAVMRDKVIPLLQEYFFEDWGRVAAVLGEPQGKGGGFLDCRKLADPTGQDGERRESWSVRRVFAPDAYDCLIGKHAPAEILSSADQLEEVAE